MLAPAGSGKLPAEELAGGGPGQLGDEVDPLRHLVGGERGRQWERSSSSSASAPSRSTTSAQTASCHSGSGATDHRRVGHAGMSDQDVLHLRRHHVLAAGDDHLVAAAGDLEEALLVDVPEVAGVQPAVGLDRSRARRSAPGRGSRPSAIRTWVVSSGRPAEPTFRSASAGARVVTWSRSRSGHRSEPRSRPGREPRGGLPPVPALRRSGSRVEPRGPRPPPAAGSAGSAPAREPRCLPPRGCSPPVPCRSRRAGRPWSRR